MERQSAGMMRMEKVQPLLICFFIVFHCRSWGVEVVGSRGRRDGKDAVGPHHPPSPSRSALMESTGFGRRLLRGSHPTAAIHARSPQSDSIFTLPLPPAYPLSCPVSLLPVCNVEG